MFTLRNMMKEGIRSHRSRNLVRSFDSNVGYQNAAELRSVESVPMEMIDTKEWLLCNGTENEPINEQFANRLKFFSLSAKDGDISEANILRKVFDRVELFDYYDGEGNEGYKENDPDELYLTNAQKVMMDALIKSNMNEMDEMHSMEPFFMVDLGDIVRQHIEWITLLPNIYPFYAVKCNPDPIIISLLNYLGCSFDCASKTEFDLLINNDINLNDENIDDKVVFSHPCKHPLHLKYAKQVGINLCTFDNEYELEKISEFHPNCKSLLRIQVDDSQSICKFNSKYGYNVDNISDVNKIFELCKKFNINLNGIMFHVGSGCLDINAYKTAIEKSKFLFDIAHNKYDFDISNMNCLDLGGGFPGINQSDSIQFKNIAKVINDALKYYFNDDERFKFIAEPGRYYVSKSHSLICDIIAKKKKTNLTENDGFMYYLNDGMYGSFNAMYFDHAVPSIVPYQANNGNKNEAKYESTIFGPSCDSMDKMYDNYLLKEMNIMDKVIIPNFGAYTGAAASAFNGFLKSKSRYIMTL